MTVSNRSLPEVTTQVFNLVLRFTPESAFDMRLVSRRLRRNTDTFLQWHVGIIGAYCSEVQSSLSSLILREFARLGSRAQPRRAIHCHLSVTRSIRSMGISRAVCRDRILSVRDIGQFDSRIENTSLQRVWWSIREQILDAWPGAAGVPVINVSAEEIRTWMRAHANRGLIAGITTLKLGGSGLTCVPKEMALCTALQRFKMTGNQIVSWPEGLFQGLTALQELNLSNNHLVSLPEGLFQGMTALREFHLSNNQLVSLPEGLFQGMTALRELYFSSNPILSLPEGLFHGLTALQKLYFSSNRIVSLPEGLFHGLTALQELDFSSNQIVSLPEGLFQGLTALQRLGLCYNQLVSLPEGLFQGLTALRELYLYNNQLVSLPERLFQGPAALQKLILYGNPRLLVSYKDLKHLNNIEFQNALREFFNYDCQSAFARLYQLAARGAPPEAVRELFSELPSTIKNAVFEKVWKEAESPDTGDPQWGEHHAFEDMPRFYGALKRYVRESFETLDSAGKIAIYGHVYHLAHRMGMANFSDLQWGEQHAFDNILRLIDAMMRL